jgi:hypothetical protein
MRHMVLFMPYPDSQNAASDYINCLQMALLIYDTSLTRHTVGGQIYSAQPYWRQYL